MRMNKASRLSEWIVKFESWFCQQLVNVKICCGPAAIVQFHSSHFRKYWTPSRESALILDVIMWTHVFTIIYFLLLSMLLQVMCFPVIVHCLQELSDASDWSIHSLRNHLSSRAFPIRIRDSLQITGHTRTFSDTNRASRIMSCAPRGNVHYRRITIRQMVAVHGRISRQFLG